VVRQGDTRIHQGSDGGRFRKPPGVRRQGRRETNQAEEIKSQGSRRPTASIAVKQHSGVTAKPPISDHTTTTQHNNYTTTNPTLQTQRHIQAHGHHTKPTNTGTQKGK
jgi:hypothetical protein